MQAIDSLERDNLGMPSEKIGRYDIKAELGRGGMATVFQAYDPSFERDVAIKVLPQVFLHDPQFRTRFEREAKMIASLEHPAIVPVYDFGEDHEQPYIVMRFMSGGSLSDRIKRDALSPDETARTLSRLAPALDAAHARGIIHRDLKPGNILYDQYGNAFLSDFGIARLAQEGGATLTGGNILGTPAYMSPEQVQGDKAIDGRSDIYALGVLTFQMLTGQLPYQADTPTKTMMMHLLEPVPHIKEINSQLPIGIDDVIAKAMAKEPGDRFATASELAAALEAAVRGQLPTQTIVSGQKIISSAQTIVSTPRTVASAVPSGGTPATASPASQPGLVAPSAPPVGRRRPVLAFTIILIILGIVIVVALIGLAYIGMQGSGPLSMLARTSTATPSPSASPTALPTSPPATFTPTVEPVAVILRSETPIPTIAPTNTPIPATATATETLPPAAPIIGGADKIAFLNASDLWVANLDGSDLAQMTDDGASKVNLRWSNDGSAVYYITGNCVQSVNVETGRIDILVCINFIDSFKAFEISPDNSQVALSLDNQLYIVPYDVDRLNQVKTRSDISAMAECSDFAPFKRNFIQGIRWSRDGTSIAAKLLIPLENGAQGNAIQILPVDSCIPNPRALDNFPRPRFEMKAYDRNPFIQNFSWDGVFLFALNNNIRNDGFGDLYVYNSDLHKARLEINPLSGKCCYRDPQWSPDGNYLLFAFQDYLQGSNSVTQLYYVPYGSIGTGVQYSPLPLPEISNPREKPQPVLRPAQ
jgi:serine/threonine protein kinase